MALIRPKIEPKRRKELVQTCLKCEPRKNRKIRALKRSKPELKERIKDVCFLFFKS